MHPNTASSARKKRKDRFSQLLLTYFILRSLGTYHLWTGGRTLQFSFLQTNQKQVQRPHQILEGDNYLLLSPAARHTCHTEVGTKLRKHNGAGDRCHLSFTLHYPETANKLETGESSALIPHPAKCQVRWFRSSKHTGETASACHWCCAVMATMITYHRTMLSVTLNASVAKCVRGFSWLDLTIRNLLKR